MHRRTFLTTSLTATLLPFAARAAGFVTYEPGLVQSALDAGETVLVDYSATWCGTCRRQARVIDDLRAENPAYDAAISFVKVDWDTFKNADVTTSRAVPRRSTLILLKGDAELGRIVAGTGKDQIAALMDLAL